MELPVRRALVSVTDKTGLVDFARRLARLGVELVSTGGTARVLREAGLTVLDVAEVTGAPEMMDGRVKTLHPRVHGGILADRSNPAHVAALAEHEITGIELVIVNLYRFEAVTAKADVALEDAIENIDVGGPTMIRAAAKNHGSVAVVTDPADYPALADELDENDGVFSEATRLRLAVKAFQRTADYDRAIASFLCARVGGDDPALPAALTLAYERAETMRYGENPHQRAALYRRVGGEPAGWFKATVHQGKTVSYNNLVDLEAAVVLSAELEAPACVIVKHTNPCGAAAARTSLTEAWEMALETDPQSAFGGIVALNGEVDGALAAKLAEIFLEVVVARAFTDEALAVLAKKKNLRVVTWRDWGVPPPFLFRQVGGGLLVQTPDASTEVVRACRVVTTRAPSDEEWKRLTFAWSVCKYVKSNAIVLADGRGLLGVGAGQMSRVDSVELALTKSHRPTAGAVLASDAFFPFKDSVERAAAAGITALVQPGGSIRDDESIAAANALGLAMVFTDTRHFRHL